MAKFKKGDRVKLCKTDYATGQLHLGMLGTVMENGTTFPIVEWDGFHGGHAGLYTNMRKSCWAVREEILELLDNPSKQEKANVNDNDLYQKIDAKQKLLDGLNKRSRDLAAQESEIYALIVKEERQLAELKRELLSALKKELGS